MNRPQGELPPWREHFAEHPAFTNLTPWAEALRGADWPDLDTLNRLAMRGRLCNAAGLPIRFTPQHSRRGQRAYEAGILADGEVPTRTANWHDLFNALCWLAYPLSKAALNALHGAVLGAGADGRRPPCSDAATLFDESGLVLAGPDPTLADLLARGRWREAFVTRRESWTALRVAVIGHAVLEKMLRPWPGITAKCLFVHCPAGTQLSSAWLDDQVARRWRDGTITKPADLFPMPVLGIPGWHPANAEPAFYDDARYFRPSRTAVNHDA